MKPPQFFTTLILSSICLILSLLTFQQGKSLKSEQGTFETDRNNTSNDFQTKQREISAGNQYSQILFRIVQEIVGASTDAKGVTKDEKLKGLLKQDGIQINVPPAGSPAPGAAAPAASPASSSTSTSHQ